VGAFDTSANSDITSGWIAFALSFVCCPLIAIAGIIFGTKAKAKGHPGASAVIIANWISIGLLLILILGMARGI
jgi:uncharacterized protein with PQ loop repeat